MDGLKAHSHKQNPSHPLYKSLPPGLKLDKEQEKETSLDSPQSVQLKNVTKKSNLKVPEISSPKQTAEGPKQGSKSNTDLGARPKVQQALDNKTGLRRSSRKRSGPIKYPK